jgi:hypothetical protein
MSAPADAPAAAAGDEVGEEADGDGDEWTSDELSTAALMASSIVALHGQTVVSASIKQGPVCAEKLITQPFLLWANEGSHQSLERDSRAYMKRVAKMRCP